MQIQDVTRNLIGWEKCGANQISCNINFSAFGVIMSQVYSVAGDSMQTNYGGNF